MQLAYQRSPGVEHCPDERLLREEIAGQLGYDPVDEKAADHLHATIFRGVGREVHATMDLTNSDGVVSWSRHLVAYNDDCKELVLNMALSIRITLDPRLRPRGGAPAPPPRERASRAPAPQPSWPEARAGVGGGVSFGTLPLVSGGPSLDIALRYPMLSFGLEARLDLPVTTELKGGDRVTSWLAAGTLTTCTHHRYLFGCGLVRLGAMMGSGSRGGSVEGLPALVAATGPRAGVELPLFGHVAAQLYGDVAIRLARTDVGPHQRAWVSPSFAGLVGLRFAFRLTPGAGRAAPSVPAAPRTALRDAAGKAARADTRTRAR